MENIAQKVKFMSDSMQLKGIKKKGTQNWIVRSVRSTRNMTIYNDNNNIVIIYFGHLQLLKCTFEDEETK